MTFSLDSYRALIQTGIDGGFSPVPFSGHELPDKPCLLLRHDVDFSLEMAVVIGRINAELGVSATFFILVRGHAYNPMSPKSFDRLGELLALGQRLGVHVAGAEQDIAADISHLASHFPVDRVFSWHNPTPQLIDKYRDQSIVEGLVNVYSKRFIEDALYCSDSNFDRSYDDLTNAFRGERKVVHLLTHPINWVAGGDSMLEVFEHAWPYLIRESELEARTNRVYAEHLPDGMPDSLLTEFSRLWREAAG